MTPVVDASDHEHSAAEIDALSDIKPRLNSVPGSSIRMEHAIVGLGSAYSLDQV